MFLACHRTQTEKDTKEFSRAIAVKCSICVTALFVKRYQNAHVKISTVHSYPSTECLCDEDKSYNC